MGILVNVLNTTRVERRRAPLDPMDHVALFEQETGQVSSILPGNAGNQRNLLTHPGLSGSY